MWRISKKKLSLFLLLSIVLFALTPEWMIPHSFVVFAHTQQFTPSKDAYVTSHYLFSGTNYGDSNTLWTQSLCVSTAQHFRTLLEFDLSLIPPNTEIVNATLHLYQYAVDEDQGQLGINRIKGSWSELAVTWDNQPDVYDDELFEEQDYCPLLQTYLWINISVTELIDQSGGINDTQGFRIWLNRIECGTGECGYNECSGECCSSYPQCNINDFWYKWFSKEYEDSEFYPYLEVTWQYTYPTNVDVSITDTEGCGYTDYNIPYTTEYEGGSGLEGYSYRKSHLITGSSGAGTDYQVKIVVHYGSGSDSGEDVYCSSHCDTDFDDIRFTDDDGVTELDYWMEEKTDSDNAVFWVEVADDLGSNQNIYLYYGKVGDSTTSSLADTWIGGDNFNQANANWVLLGGTGSHSISGGVLHIDWTGGLDYTVQNDNEWTDDTLAGRMRIRMSFDDLSSGGSKAGLGRSGSEPEIGVNRDQTGILKVSHPGGDTQVATGCAWSVSTYYVFTYLYVTDSLYGECEGQCSGTHDPATEPVASDCDAMQIETYLNDIDVDWIVYGKYVSPEPAHSTWGSEEEMGTIVIAPVLLMHMDEDFNTFNIVDDSDYANHGVLSGDGDEWVARPLSYALMLDGVDDYINVSDDASLDLNDAFTIELWFKTSNASQTGTFVMKYNTTLGKSNYRLWFTGGYLKLNVYDGTNDLYVTSPSNRYGDDRWHHVVGHWERGENASLWVDGNLVNSTVDTITGTITNDWTLTIGVDNDFENNHFEGFIDELRMYDRVLPSDEIVRSYRHGEAHYNNWIFAGDQFYTFQAKYSPYWVGENTSDVDDLDYVALAFTDRVHWINATVDLADEEWYLLDGSDVATLQHGEISYENGNVTVTYELFLNEFVLDTLNVDLYLWCNNTDGVETNWELKAVDYFHIYNQGGLNMLTYDGTAGKVTGGDAFELYAYADDDENGYWALSNVTYRRLQHWESGIHIAFPHYSPGAGISLDVDGNPYVGHWLYGLDFCYEGTWYSGWYANITLTDITVGASNYWLNYTVGWYYHNELLKMEEICAFADAELGANNPHDGFSIWIDFWFDVKNSSTVYGGRIVSQFFGIRDTSPWWQFWSSNWGPIEELLYDSQYMGDLTVDDEIISSRSLTMMRVWHLIEHRYTESMGFNISTMDYEEQRFNVARDMMMGINTPPKPQTQLPDMPLSGLFAPIIGALQHLGNELSRMLGVGILSFWPIFVGFLDTVFSVAGWENGFSTLLSWIESFLVWLIAGINYAINMLFTLFQVFAVWLSFGIQRFVEVGAGFVTIYDNLVWIYEEANAGWVDVSPVVTQLLPLIPVGFFIWFLASEDIEHFIRKVLLVWNLIRSIVGFLIQIGQYVIQLISSLIEAIPGVE